MNQVTKRLSLSACALAASVMISACGGGALSTDTTPPTVSISSAAGTAGAVTFTFTFSEELAANTFTVEDIVVTGGSAGALVKVDSTHYTLQVTPNSNTVTLSVAANKYDDIAHNFNTTSVNNTYAATSSTALVTFEEANAPKFTGFGGAEEATIVTDPAGGTGKVAKIIKSTTAELWAGTTVSTGANDSIATIGFTETAKTLTARVWSPAAGIPVRLKVENAADGTKSVETEAITTVANGWQILTFNFANQAAGTAALNLATIYNKASIFFNFGKTGATGGGGTYYFDDLTFGSASSTTTPTTPPTPTPTGTVINFSAAGIGFGLFENQGGGTVAIANDPTDATNKVVKFVKKSGDPDYFGTTITGLGGSVVLTDAAKTITMKVFSPTKGTNFLLKLEGGPGGAVTEKDAVTTQAGAWETLSFVMPAAGTYSTVVLFPNGRSRVGADTTMYVDDLTFPSLSPSTGSTNTASTAFTGGVYAAEYAGNLAIAGSTKSNLGGEVGFYFDPRLAANKLYDFGGVGTLAENPGGVPNFYYGLGLNKPAITDAYFGAFVNAPGNATVDVSGFTNLKLNFWGPAELFEKTFTPSVRILLAGPVVAGCTSDSGRSEIQTTVNALKVGAASNYTLSLNNFTIKAACSGDTAAQVLTKVAQVHIQLINTNIQYLVPDTGNPPGYSNGLNIGPIGFN